jgi:hypothetical protein
LRRKGSLLYPHVPIKLQARVKRAGIAGVANRQPSAVFLPQKGVAPRGTLHLKLFICNDLTIFVAPKRSLGTVPATVDD